MKRGGIMVMCLGLVPLTVHANGRWKVEDIKSPFSDGESVVATTNGDVGAFLMECTKGEYSSGLEDYTFAVLDASRIWSAATTKISISFDGDADSRLWTVMASSHGGLTGIIRNAKPSGDSLENEVRATARYIFSRIDKASHVRIRAESTSGRVDWDFDIRGGSEALRRLQTTCGPLGPE